jgi:hypothetical protein
MMGMDGKAPVFTTVPALVGEADKSNYLSTKVVEAPVAVTPGKDFDDETLKTVLTGLFSGVEDKAIVDDVPTKVVLHFRRRV